MTFAERLEEWRSARSWSQSELARRSKVDRGGLNKMFHGRPPTFACVKKVAAGFGVPVKELLAGVDDLPADVLEAANYAEQTARSAAEVIELSAALAAAVARADGAERDGASVRVDLAAARARVASLEVGAKFAQATIAELRTGVAERDAVVTRLRDLNGGMAGERDAAYEERDQHKTMAARALRSAQAEHRTRLAAEGRAAQAEQKLAGLGVTAALFVGAKLLGGRDG